MTTRLSRAQFFFQGLLTLAALALLVPIDSAATGDCLKSSVTATKSSIAAPTGETPRDPGQIEPGKSNSTIQSRVADDRRQMRSGPPDTTPYSRPVVPEDYAPFGEPAIPPGIRVPPPDQTQSQQNSDPQNCEEFQRIDK